MHCQIPAGDHGRYQNYEQEVRGYHCDEFSAAITDAGNLLAALQGTAGFEIEIRWLLQVIDELSTTQQSIAHGCMDWLSQKEEVRGCPRNGDLTGSCPRL